MPTAIQSLDILAFDLPDLFESLELDHEWLDDWLVLPIDQPDKASVIATDGNDDWLDRPFEPQSNEPPDRLPVFNGDTNSDHAPINTPPYPGGLIAPWQIQQGNGVGGHPSVIPPDCLAFYLPIHFYYPDFWGIYLLAEGVEYWARQIWDRHTTGANKILSPRECRIASRIYLYWHEHYHHQIECYSIRLELTHRQPLYRSGFRNLYRNTFGKPNCTEETMAEVQAYRKTLHQFRPTPNMRKREKSKQLNKQKALSRALISMIKSSPEGYRQAASVIKQVDSRKVREKHFYHKFTERCHIECFPHAARVISDIWDNSPYLTRGFSNIRSRVNYLIPKGSQLIQRIPLEVHPRLTKRELLQGLKSLIHDLEVIPPRGKHTLKVKRPGMRAVPIPVHPGDISTGTLSKIIKQLGLDMNINQFTKAI